MGRFLDKGWILPETMILVFVSSMVACLGIFACGIGACASLGNNKLKRIGGLLGLAGSAFTFLSVFGLINAHAQLVASAEAERIMPNNPLGIQVLIIFALAFFVLSLLFFFLTPKPKQDEKCHLEQPMELFLWLLPFVILVFLFFLSAPFWLALRFL